MVFVRLLWWVILLVPYFIMQLLVFPCAIIGVLCYSAPSMRTLTRMRWLETIDNDLTGDSGWREKHLIGTDPFSKLNRIRWLWRNGGNSVNYNVFGIQALSEAEHTRVTTKYPEHILVPWFAVAGESGHWYFRSALYLGFGWYLESMLGWNLFGPQHGRCKYVCTIRPKRNIPAQLQLDPALSCTSFYFGFTLVSVLVILAITLWSMYK